MQRGEQQFFKDRSVFYSTFPIREQARRGEWDYELKAVYVVGILNFSFDPSDTGYFHHEVKLVDLYTKKVFYDKLTFVYLEMPKFNKTEDELKTMFDKWLFVLRNLSSLLERPRSLQNRVFATENIEALTNATVSEINGDTKVTSVTLLQNGEEKQLDCNGVSLQSKCSRYKTSCKSCQNRQGRLHYCR